MTAWNIFFLSIGSPATLKPQSCLFIVNQNPIGSLNDMQKEKKKKSKHSFILSQIISIQKCLM